MQRTSIHIVVRYSQVRRIPSTLNGILQSLLLLPSPHALKMIRHICYAPQSSIYPTYLTWFATLNCNFWWHDTPLVFHLSTSAHFFYVMGLRVVYNSTLFSHSSFFLLRCGWLYTKLPRSSPPSPSLLFPSVSAVLSHITFMAIFSLISDYTCIRTRWPYRNKSSHCDAPRSYTSTLRRCSILPPWSTCFIRFLFYSATHYAHFFIFVLAFFSTQNHDILTNCACYDWCLWHIHDYIFSIYIFHLCFGRDCLFMSRNFQPGAFM